jgi:hypothetical protein
MLISFLAEDGHETRVIGGAPRNALLGLLAKDIDLCTTAVPVEVMRSLKERGIRMVPTGLSHGTVMAVIEGEGYEITTLRADVETDGRHATVSFHTDFAKDSERRDFTMNALSVSLRADGEGNLHDYHEGRSDILARRIRFVGDARERITEDTLRSLRFYRFGAQYGMSFDMRDRQAVRELVDGLDLISGERFWQEMSKLVVSKGAGQCLRMMAEDGVAERLGLNPARILEHSSRLTSNVTALAPIPFGLSPAGLIGLGLEGEDAVHALTARWKWSGEDQREALFMVRHRGDAARPIEFFENMLVDGADRRWVSRLLGMTGRTNDAQILADWDIPEMPLKGRDLLAAGLKHGRHIGAILSEAKQIWVASRLTASCADLLETVLADGTGWTPPTP